MIDILIRDETAPLKSVVLGRAESMGGTPSLEEAYDPKSKEFILAGNFPEEKNVIPELEAFGDILEKHGVKVYRPDIIKNLNQIFSRDIGFVIEDKLIVPNIIAQREEEKSGLSPIVQQIDASQKIYMPKGCHAEGGDIMPWKGNLFVGYEKEEDFNRYKVSRTNEAGVRFIESCFPDYDLYAFELKKSDDIALENALHLDCCFQPIGSNMCIIYKGGFKNEKDFDFLVDFFGKENCIEISQQEMYEMNSNIFSISPEVIVSEKQFTRLNSVLRARGFLVEEVSYTECAKMEGLLRCSTLPLERVY